MAIKVTIEQIEMVWKKQRTWNKVTDDVNHKQYEYVDAELPVVEKTLLLEQCLPELDLPAVIKAINKL